MCGPVFLLDHLYLHVSGPGLVPGHLGAAPGVVAKPLAGPALGVVSWAVPQLASLGTRAESTFYQFN